ncbi:hypothetical protein SAMN06265220_10739 [Flavobacterium nitrogenifigens]|uniref:Uncharacterized protein n=3 Tax=Flavobacterium nitrogenifigens TaxID=1617283 RepID=A0A521F9L4_9FLAO|nr:hypothetical protein SAMN06265220_10739 [Flavobacterium nitrogenifigens]
MATKSYNDKKMGTYIFGSVLLVFFIYIFLFSPDTLPFYKQRMMAFASSLLAGLFAFFLSGSVRLTGQSPETKFGKITMQAGSGIAVFILVLIWWMVSPPISADKEIKEAVMELSAIKIKDITARVTFHIDNADERAPDFFKNTAELELRIIEDKDLDSLNVQGWKNGFFISGNSLDIISSTQLFDRKLIQSVDLSSIELIRNYRDFKGKINSLKDNKKWAKSSFEGLMQVVETNKWLDSLKRGSDSLDFPVTFDDFLALYKVTNKQKIELTEYDYRIKVYPIRAKLEVFKNDSLVGISEGIVVKVWEHDEDVRNLFVVKFPVTKLNL